MCSKAFNALHERDSLSSVHVSSERARQQHAVEQNALAEVQRGPATSTRRLFYTSGRFMGTSKASTA
jgi:hypothetical protein